MVKQKVIAQASQCWCYKHYVITSWCYSTLVSLVTDTLTNKTLTTPVIAEIDSGAILL